MLKDADPKMAECFAAYLTIRDPAARLAITNLIISIAGSTANQRGR
jgi:hypothetical protein